MKIANRTRYDSAALRRLVVETHRRLAKTEGPHPRWDRLTAEFRTGRYSGRGRIGGAWILVRLPAITRRAVRIAKALRATGNIVPLPALPDAAYTARTIEHELLHNYGYVDERRMRRADRHALKAGWFDWAREMFPDGIPLAPKKVRPPRDLVAERFARIVAAERRWKTKAKRAATALRRLATQRRYYERKMAARTAPAETREETNDDGDA